MNPKVKKLWLKALPKYRQGRKRMRHAGRYCCLGVLQMVAIEQGIKFDPDWGSSTELPKEVMKWSRMTYSACREAAERNDGDGYPKHSFEEIAAWIKKSL